MQRRCSRFRPAFALAMALTVTISGFGLTGCSKTTESCASETGGGDCRDPSDFTWALSGSLVLEVDGWTDGSRVAQPDGVGDRWEYPVTVSEVLYQDSTFLEIEPGPVTLVAPVPASGGAPAWSTEISGPVYVVAGRSLAQSGPIKVGELVVQSVFDENLNIIGMPKPSTNLHRFIDWLEEKGRQYDPPAEFLVDWVRSLIEGTQPAGEQPLDELWLEYQSPGPDPERNLDPSTADPEVAERLKMVRLGLDSSELTGTDGFIAVFSDRGQLATMPTGHSTSSSFVWVLPGEKLEVRLLDDYGAVSTQLGTVPKNGLGESLVDASVHVSGTPSAPEIELREGPVELDESPDVVVTLPPAAPTPGE